MLEQFFKSYLHAGCESVSAVMSPSPNRELAGSNLTKTISVSLRRHNHSAHDPAVEKGTGNVGVTAAMLVTSNDVIVTSWVPPLR